MKFEELRRKVDIAEYSCWAEVDEVFDLTRACINLLEILHGPEYSDSGRNRHAAAWKSFKEGP